jgi:hypothetical protein
MLLQPIPPGREDRWHLASQFLQHWIRPLTAEDRVSPRRLDATDSRLGLRLPVALREWYLRLGCSGDVWSVQDTFLTPEGLRVQDDLLVVYVENQTVWYMGVRLDDLDSDDPPVAIDEEGLGEGTRTLSPSISLLALQMLAYAVKFARPVEVHLFGFWTEATLRAIEQHYSRSALPPLHLFGQETVHYEGLDAWIEVSGGDGYLYPSFRTDDARRRFEQVVGGTGFEWGM